MSAEERTNDVVDIPGLIQASAYFDHAFYRAQTGLGRDVAEAVHDYLTRGELAGLKPSATFDPAFYLAAYDDVAAAGLNALAHFVEHGAKERRYPSRERLAEDAQMIAERGLFDANGYARQGDDGLDLALTDAEHYLLFGGFQGAWPNADFDSLFYRGVYPDVSATRENPLVHYARIGRREGRFTNGVALHAAVERIKLQFDEAYYRRQNPKLSKNDEDNLPRHYLVRGVLVGLEPAPDFSAAYYRRRYPDLDLIGVEPFGHYVKYGRAEGRQGKPSYKSFYRNGELEFDRSKPTLLIANHEGSRTGAPLVGLALAKAFAATHNVITYLGRDRGLVDPFLESSMLVAIGEGEVSAVDAEFMLQDMRRQFGLNAVLANSVETHAIVKAALQVDLPSVVLVHEFAEYSLPHGKVADVIAAADRAVVPASIVMASAQKELRAYFGAESSNIVVRAQGLLKQDSEPDDTDLSVAEILRVLKPNPNQARRIVLGAGYVQIRKGVDLFVETAREVAKLSDDVCFAWVGDGYDPEHDLGLSIWLRELIERSGLADRVFMFPAQSSLDAFFEVADAFYLPSRLDPYPNVGVDAIALGKPLICFKDSTGLAELIETGKVIGSVVDYCDTTKAAQAIVDQFAAAPPLADANAAFTETLGFEAYVDFLKGELEKAHQVRRIATAARDRIASNGVFDAAFHLGASENNTAEASLTSFVAHASKGLTSADPRPGFSNGLWMATQGSGMPPLTVALDVASRNGDGAPTTHDCRILTGVSARRVPEGGVALHVHMHYPELAKDFLERLKSVKTEIDLFITTTSRTKQIQIQAAFINYRRGRVEVFDGPNLGRDIGPFMTTIGDAVLAGGYAVIGHLHGKKSLAAGGSLGDRWRTYLLDTLLGTPAEIAQIFDMFADDPRLGLVFPEDRHAISWSANRAIAEALADRLSPRPNLPGFPIFPIGNMFWAKPEAVAPLWRAGLQWDEYPAEPAPFDGTILHAVERMLPAICESTGHHWSTLFKRGSGW
ncbi:rhamnan synthesis F family protein [Caulobacter sp. UNC279MFTsu5.1]|uniref:rhamnan synthesis F family protein n=1 Tax=Caulobacter sp. UNC279MFTsu5.1 TaxID=1502775 RepID=UPI0015A5CCF9|nr:rhamnan synthesis F family protein [Caulobacter sp. UNC279MFTsu5.1]